LYALKYASILNKALNNNHKKIIFLLYALLEDSPKSTFCKN